MTSGAAATWPEAATATAATAAVTATAAATDAATATAHPAAATETARPRLSRPRAATIPCAVERPPAAAAATGPTIALAMKPTETGLGIVTKTDIETGAMRAGTARAGLGMTETRTAGLAVRWTSDWPLICRGLSDGFVCGRASCSAVSSDPLRH